MSYIRSDGLSFPENPRLDAILQMIIGDLKRQQLALMRGAKGSAYLRRDQGLTDITNTSAASTAIGSYSVGFGIPVAAAGAIITTPVIAAGTGVHTFNPASTFAQITIIGGGGGGYGPLASGGSTPSSPGGGGAGAKLDMLIDTRAFPVIGYTVGAAGLGGFSATDGSASLISVPGVGAFTAPGGESGLGTSSPSGSVGGRGGQGYAGYGPAPWVFWTPGMPGQSGGVIDIQVFDPNPSGMDYFTGNFRDALGGKGWTDPTGVFSDAGAGGQGELTTASNGIDGAMIIREFAGG
jgi:hypothetical protein